MSFKREGDDPSQLNVLKKRRVADLLANYIPEDEALLLRDGRYTCTVCFHRPVFDTLDMLTVHRSGKKHIASLQKFYGKKRSLEKEVQKRHHQAYLHTEEDGTQATPGPAPLLVHTRKIAQNALLKTAPYSSCSGRNRTTRSNSGPNSSRPGAGSRNAEGEELPKSSTQIHKDRSRGMEATPATQLPDSPERMADSPKEAAPKSDQKSKGTTSSPTGSDKLTPEKRRTLEHYLRLKSSGWVPDGSGKWVKDENVEFDSDEEEPPPLSAS
ncbi:sodium channel modifier 1 [Hemicordylus capensis]|uniref:sodium channel modifier 1 n=1 Tax=Hemicordylus capensis TaxID=884348 RepID=UPI002304B5DF|nr:sodium channel modifier 1 [Hemicordylus capensis]